MQSLKLINEISDETFNKVLKEFSFPSKRFMARIRVELKKYGVSLATKQLKESIFSFLSLDDFERNSDPLLVHLSQNSEKYEEEIILFIEEMKKCFFQHTAFVQTAFDNKSLKSKIFQMEYKIIQNVLLNRGNSFKSTEFSEKVDQQLSYLIDCNKTPLRVLQPNQIATNFFLQDMLDKLAIKGYISKKFKNEQAQTNWIHKAFNVEFHYTNQHEKDILKIDWNNLNSLADWLLFLKKSCIVYNHKNNKQLLDWVLEHVVYKGKNFSKGSTNYESLIRSIKIRKKQEGLYFSVDEKKLFQIKYIPHAVNSLNN